jgi:hypothetical protein
MEFHKGSSGLGTAHHLQLPVISTEAAAAGAAGGASEKKLTCECKQRSIQSKQRK